MTRKDLNSFNPDSLLIGQSKSFEVRNPQTGFKQVHYFYRDADGEIFRTVYGSALDRFHEGESVWKLTCGIACRRLNIEDQLTMTTSRDTRD